MFDVRLTILFFNTLIGLIIKPAIKNVPINEAKITNEDIKSVWIAILIISKSTDAFISVLSYVDTTYPTGVVSTKTV